MKAEIEKIPAGEEHRGAVYALEYAGEAGSFFSGGSDGFVVLRRTGSNDVSALAHTLTPIYSLLHLSERGILVAGERSGNVHFIDLNESREIKNLQCGNKEIFDLQRSPDGKYIAAATGEGVVYIISTEDFSFTKSLTDADKSARVLRFNPITKDLAVGYSDHHIRIFDENFSLKKTIQAHASSVFSMGFTPDGNFLFTGGRDAHLIKWNTVNDYQQEQNIIPHLYTINSISMHSSGKYIATGSRDKSIRLWKTENTELIKTIDFTKSDGHKHSVNKLLWLDDATLISTGDDGKVMGWKIIFSD